MVMDCPSWSLSGSSGPVCHASPTGGIAPGLGTAVWVWAGSVWTLLGIWIPVLKAETKNVERAVTAFTENLGRVLDDPHVETESPAPETEPQEPAAEKSETTNSSPPDHEAVLDLIRQELSRLQQLAASGSMPPRDWLALLVELNGLHNDGLLPTEHFKGINTELIGLVAEPMARAEGQPELPPEPALAAV